jgi:hypothetical protein
MGRDTSGMNEWQEVPAAVNTGDTTPLRRNRRTRADYDITQLNVGSLRDISDYETEEEEEAISGDGDGSGVNHEFRDDTWSTKYFTYDPKPKDFTGRMDTTQFFANVPSILTLFGLFWPFSLLCKIVMETNQYATHVLDAMGNSRGGPKWVNMSVAEL